MKATCKEIISEFKTSQFKTHGDGTTQNSKRSTCFNTHVKVEKKTNKNITFFFLSCAIILSILFSKINPGVSCIFEST